MSLEEQLLDDLRQRREVDIERALLIIAGCETEDQITAYTGKLDQLHTQLQAYKDDFYFDPEAFPAIEALGSDALKAMQLHFFLWQGREKRAKEGGNFLLTDVLDAQFSDTNEVGNCVGLTSLYTVLAIREGLDVGVLSIPQHVKTRVNLGNTVLDIENTIAANAIDDYPQNKKPRIDESTIPPHYIIETNPTD